MFIRQLRYLVALARECHFARAAAACHVSQPTLSAGLHKLECELGVRIIERTPQFRGFTPEGERVLIWAQRILADWQALVQDVSEESREGLQGTVRLGVVPAALPAVGVLVEEFCARYPATRVLIQQMSSRSIGQRLAEFELDAGLTYLDNEPLKEVIAQPLYREHYVFLTAVDGPWSGVRCVSWREIKDVPLCLLSQDMQMRRILDAAFRSAGVVPCTVVEANSFIALYSLVRAGPWSSVFSHTFLTLFGVPPSVRALPLTDPAPAPTLGLVVLNREPVSPIARAQLAATENLTLQPHFDTNSLPPDSTTSI